MMFAERAFIGFNNIGVVVLNGDNIIGGLVVDCPANDLPRIGESVTGARVRAWASAFSRPEISQNDPPLTPPRGVRVLSSNPKGQEVQHQRIKMREIIFKNGSQASFTPVLIRAVHGDDILTGVIGA